MSKFKYNRSPFVLIERELLNSSAFIELPKTASKVFLWFLARRQFVGYKVKGSKEWSNYNNGEIVFSYPEAETKFKLSRPRFSRALTALIEYGFIDINHHGGGMLGDASTYYISERWRDYGTDKFEKKTRQKDTRKLGFASEKMKKRLSEIRRAL